MQFIGRMRFFASSSLTPLRPRRSSLRAKRSCSTSGWVMVRRVYRRNEKWERRTQGSRNEVRGGGARLAEPFARSRFVAADGAAQCARFAEERRISALRMCTTVESPIFFANGARRREMRLPLTGKGIGELWGSE